MSPGELIRVVVVDDSAFVQVVIAKTLQADPSIKVVGRAGNGKEAVEMVLPLSYRWAINSNRTWVSESVFLT